MSGPTVFVMLQQFCERDPRPRQILLDAGFSVRENTLGRRVHREELPALLQQADAVIAGVEPYDATLLAALPRLRCISRCGIGTDAIDLEAARRRGMVVYTTAEEVVEPVAQMTLAMILALARNVPQHLADARGGRWKKYTGVLLREWTIGLVGFGRIGQAVAHYLQVFGPRLLVTDPQRTSQALSRDIQLCDLETLLSRADIVSVHAARPREAGVLIGRRELARMRQGSFLVNTARGYLVDEVALCEALNCGHLAGAALDVYGTEPYAGPLTTLPQVLCTPHVATLTRESRTAMELRCAQNVLAFFARHGGPALSEERCTP